MEYLNYALGDVAQGSADLSQASGDLSRASAEVIRPSAEVFNLKKDLARGVAYLAYSPFNL